VQKTRKKVVLDVRRMSFQVFSKSIKVHCARSQRRDVYRTLKIENLKIKKSKNKNGGESECSHPTPFSPRHHFFYF